jgi:hypothetical protein
VHFKDDGWGGSGSGTDRANVHDGRTRVAFARDERCSFRRNAIERVRDAGASLCSARTQREAIQIILDTADRFFGWDACTF